jgi:hypothetical protein
MAKKKIRSKKKSDENGGDDWEKQWNERLKALEDRLGPSAKSVYHAFLPMEIGGTPDIVYFTKYVPGYTYVTAELTGWQHEQKKNRIGNYELMICSRKKSDFALSVITELARYTLESKFNVGDTIDLAGAVPKSSNLAALLLAEPDVKNPRFKLFGKPAHLMLCVGITGEELAFHQKQKGGDGLLKLLKQKKVFPYTDMKRKPVV